MLDHENDAYQELLLREFSELKETLPEKEQSVLKEAFSTPGEHLAQHVNILLTIWAYCKIQIVMFEEANEDEDGSGGSTNYRPPSETVLLKTTPDITTVETGFRILDYGQTLITSVGQHYGKYFFSSGPLLRTIDIMLARVARRGALSINVSGGLNAKRFAWKKCKQYNILLNNFEPSETDAKREQWMSHKTPLRP